jgi:hypothetical protein
MLGAGVLVLGLGGCTTEETASVSNPTNPAQKPTATQSFSKPLVAENPENKGANLNRIPGLLQSTDPTERARQVQAGIKATVKDPFSNMPSITSFKAAVPRPSSDRPAAAPDKRLPEPSVPNQPDKPSGGTSGMKPLPPLPDTNLAKAVKVTGVMVIGGVPQAIVQAPNEASSRYVQAGQRLSNGQVLVKRIEMNSGSDPVVVLEENGVEVSKMVGSEASESPTAMGVRSHRLG